MPIEYTILSRYPPPLKRCPFCGDEPFRPFLRGMVQRAKRDIRGRRRGYCLLICEACKVPVGYEAPPWNARCWRHTTVSDMRQKDESWDRILRWGTVGLLFAVFLQLLFSLL